MIRFRTAFLGIAAVIVVHILAIGMGWYGGVSWFDVPMHFFGGYVMALLGLAVWGWILLHVEIRTKTLAFSPYARLILEGVFVVGFALLVGVAWEWYEFLFDQFATSFVQKFGVAQMGLPDTMDDLLNDTIGALTAWGFWRNKA
ncbi:MAG: hypothetical protein AAB473_00850 [Patescibacteria group bacterium]